MLTATTRATLVSALCSYAGDQRQRKARRFLEGLSLDELQYIAEYLGSCILECQALHATSRCQIEQGIRRFQTCRRHACRDEHKMILLLEYLWDSGVRS